MCTPPVTLGGEGPGHVNPCELPYARCPQVVKKIPLPFFAVSLSLSPRAHFMAIGFAGEYWWVWPQPILVGLSGHAPQSAPSSLKWGPESSTK